MFGFLKKIVGALAGGKKNGSKPQQKKNKKGGKQQNGRQQNNRQQNGRQNNQRNNENRRDNGRGRPPRRPANNRPEQGRTPEGQRRPGGEVSSKEMQRRAAEHAKWDPNSFVVEPMEGKKRFQDLDLPGEVMHGIADLGFKYCTEIQALSLEAALAGKNIAGKAQTGSGKTAAFLVAILTRYLRTPESRAKSGGTPRALVIAPTRELVIQISKDADAIGRYCGLRSLAVYGGMDYDRQRKEVLDAPVDLLVATPGRLLDFVKSHVINLANVDTLVIDEADRMLDMGFIPDVRRIMSYLPPKNKRATMLYSATLNETVMRLASQWMEEPFKAEVESETNATDTVRQVVYVIQSKDKFKVLFNHLALHPTSRTIVFCNRKNTTEDVYDSLKVRGIKVEMLSGDVNQNKRLRVLDDFRAGKVMVVVATDVAGRGIDIKGLEYVVNFDFPYEAEDYVHRIGRTGRAGSTGIAISFADEFESMQIPDIEKYINEELKCTVIGPEDPLMKPLPARGTKLEGIDEAAKAAVDAREAVTEEEKAAAAAMTGTAAAMTGTTAAMTGTTAPAPLVGRDPRGTPPVADTPVRIQQGANAVTGSGAKAILKEEAPMRTLPKFEHALDPKKPLPDESNIYSKPVDQRDKLVEWSV